MGWRERLGLLLLGKQIERQTLQSVLDRVTTVGAPPVRGAPQILAAYNASPWLRATTSKIAYHIAAVPWILRAVRRNGKYVRASGLQVAGFKERKSYMSRLVREKQATVEEIIDHPMLDMIATPNPWLTGLNARKVTQVHLDLLGEGFWVLERFRNTPIEYWPTPPSWCTRIPTNAIEPFEFTVNGQKLLIPQEDVIWFKDPNPAAPYGRGSGIGMSLGDELDTDEYATKFVKSVFFNRARPDLLVAIENAPTEKLGEAEERWNQKNRGVNRAGRAYFHSGKMKVEKIQQNFEELQMIELRSWERDTFISVYGIPPEILGVLGSSNRATVTEARKIFAEEVIIPRMEALRAELQARLVTQYDARLVLDFEDPSPDDWDFRLDVMKAAPWAYTVAEWRTLGSAMDRGDQDDYHLVEAGLIGMKPGELPKLPEPKTAPKGLGGSVVLQLPESTGRCKSDTVGAVSQTEMTWLPVVNDKVDKVTGIDSVADQLQPDHISDELMPVWENQMEDWGNAEIIAYGGQAHGSFDMLNPFVVDHLEEVSSTRIAGINATTRTQVRAAMSAGVQAGESPREIAKRINGVFDYARDTRAVTIARTEVNSSANFATWRAQDISKLPGRQWITNLIGARPEHATANAQIRAINVPFDVGGERLMYPGDHTGSAWNVIACRCTSVGLNELPKGTVTILSKEETDAIFKSWESRTDPWVDAATDVLRKAFTAQEALVLDRFWQLYGG